MGQLTLPLNEMPFGIDGADILSHRDSHILCRNRYGIAQFTPKQLSHFVKTNFDKLPKEDSKQLI